MTKANIRSTTRKDANGDIRHIFSFTLDRHIYVYSINNMGQENFKIFALETSGDIMIHMAQNTLK